MFNNKNDGILSHKYYLNRMFITFGQNIQTFVNLFKTEILLENANQILEGVIKSDDQLQNLSVTSSTINMYYEAIFYNKDQDQFQKYFNKDVQLRSIFEQYENIASQNQNEIIDFIEQVQILKFQYLFRFIENLIDITSSCEQLLKIFDSKYALQYKKSIEIINPLHENIIKKVLQIQNQIYRCFKTFDNFELVSSQIQQFINIYTLPEFDFRGQKLMQLLILLQYFEILLDNKLQKHQYVDFKNFQNLENVRDPNKIDQVLQIYSDNLRQEFYMKFTYNIKITKNIRRQVKDVFRSQLVQDIMKSIQQSLNLQIDLSWDFLPYIALVVIPNCNFMGFTLRNHGITINLTPFLDLYQKGFTDGYEEIMNAYCILVAINGWNCLQLIKKTQKSFYWYDDRLKNLNLEEFAFFKNLFGITRLEENKQLFSLQYLNKDTAKLILSIGEQQYAQDELHHIFRDYFQIQQNQTHLQLFHETIAEQLEIGIKLD